MAIDAVSATSSSNTPEQKSSSSHGKTIGIAVGVTIPVVIIAFIVIFLYFRRKKQSPAATGLTDSSEGQVQHAGQRREADAELDARPIPELVGSSGPQGIDRMDTSQSFAQFASEKESYPKGRSEMAELTGDQTMPELSQSAPLLGPMEMDGSRVAPVELPANEVRELPGSPVTRNVSSARSSSFRRSRGFFQSRSSTSGFPPSSTSGHASPDHLVGGPSTSNQPTTTVPAGNDVLSPISPLAEGENSTSPGGFWRGFSHLRRLSGRTRDNPQPNFDDV